MKKRILFLSILLSGLWVWGQETTSYITLGETPVRENYIIRPAKGDMQSLGVDVKFTYDQSKEVVTLQMIMRSREYTHVWIPPMQDSCLMRYAKDFTPFRTTRLFRKGLDRRDAMKGITCSNCRLADVTNCGLYAIDDTIQVCFRLKNQDVDTFVIVINNIVPIKDKKSFFGLGKLRHHYMYFGGPLRWEVAIQRNPCIMQHNIAMKERIENLSNHANNVEDHLNKTKFKEECERCKKERVAALRNTLNELKEQLDKLDKHLLCKTLKKELIDIEPKIASLENFKCPDTIIDPPVTQRIAAEFLDNAHDSIVKAMLKQDFQKCENIFKKYKPYRDKFPTEINRVDKKYRKIVKRYDEDVKSYLERHK